MKTISNIYKHAATVLAAASLFWASCQSSAPQSGNEADTASNKVKKGKITKRTQDGCYIYVSGNQMKDTLYVQLHVQNNKVSGKMIDAIYEKDRRKGTLAGVVNDNKTISALWTYTQEGSTDTISVALKLDHTGLYQKPLKTDASTGRQVTDATAPYSIALKPADCNVE